MALSPPGTPPFSSSRFRSPSTRTTRRPWTVVRTLPIWPAIRTPLKTRAASVAPIEPGWRTFIEPWLSGPREKRWRLTRPWKPFPFEVEVTSTRSPSAKRSAFNSWPTSSPS